MDDKKFANPTGRLNNLDPEMQELEPRKPRMVIVSGDNSAALEAMMAIDFSDIEVKVIDSLSDYVDERPASEYYGELLSLPPEPRYRIDDREDWGPDPQEDDNRFPNNRKGRRAAASKKGGKPQYGGYQGRLRR